MKTRHEFPRVRGMRGRHTPMTGRATGFTLVELMISLTLGLMLIAAVMALQLGLSRQSSRNADVGFRDNEARAAMDAIARDLGGAGFLLGGMPVRCGNAIRFNAQAPTTYSRWLPVHAEAAASGSDLSFVARAGSPATGLSMNYPGTGVRSDVLAVNVLTDTSRLSETVTPSVATIAAAQAVPLTNGQLAFGSAVPSAADQVGLLQVPINGVKTCIRVPISSILTGPDRITSSGDLMPATFYDGFRTQMSGVAGGLSNNLIAAGGKLTVLGPTSVNQYQTVVYFVDQGNRNWPVLRRATVNALNDQLVAGSAVDVAAGVVSFQVTFGTGAGTTVANYRTWAGVVSNGEESQVRTVRVALIVRSLFAEADPAYAAPATITPNGTGFSAYTVPAAFTRFRHSVIQTEVAVRNSLWP